MPATSGDLKTIGILLGLGALTTRQAARVEAALERGLSMEEAFRALPLIEPIDLLRARRLLGADGDGRLATEAPPPPIAPKPAAGLAKPLARDADGIPFMEMEEPPDLPVHTPPDKRLRPVEATPPAEAEPKHPEELTTPQITPPDPPEPAVPLQEVPRIELGKDDGIPLVREVHDLLLNAPRGNLRGFQLAGDSVSGAVADYAVSGKRLAARSIEAAEAEKMSAHLKVVARLSPRKAEAQEGWFVASRQNVRLLVHVKSESREGLSQVTVCLFENFDG